jgi:hypothetical protein
LLRWGQPYVDEGAEAYERRYQATRLTTLKTKARELGYELIPNHYCPAIVFWRPPKSFIVSVMDGVSFFFDFNFFRGSIGLFRANNRR